MQADSLLPVDQRMPVASGKLGDPWKQHAFTWLVRASSPHACACKNASMAAPYSSGFSAHISSVASATVTRVSRGDSRSALRLCASATDSRAERQRKNFSGCLIFLQKLEYSLTTRIRLFRPHLVRGVWNGYTLRLRQQALEFSVHEFVEATRVFARE